MPGGFFAFLIMLILGGATLSGSTRTIRQGNQALVETLGRYQGRKLEPGFHFLMPILDRVAAQETMQERVLDIPPQKCITRDNVAITVDAVVYWRIVNLEKATYKVQSLHDAMVNLVLTQIRAEVGKLELDQTFTARSEVNEVLLRELDLATDPWGVKVNRVELRDIVPAKAVQESMELQMSAERRKRAAILTSEGEREAAINSARGRAEAQVLEAEANQRALIFKAQAEQKQAILRAQASASALKILSEALQNDARANEALQFLLAQSYMDMGFKLGESPSSKVMFMDPRNIPATFEGVKSILAGERSPHATPSTPSSTSPSLPPSNAPLDFPSLDLKSLDDR